MIPEENQLKKSKLNFQLHVERHIRNLLVSEISDVYYLWKIRYLWNKIKTYSSDLEKIKYKLLSLVQRVRGKNASGIKPFPDTFSNAYKNKLLKYIFLLKRKRNKDEDLATIQKLLDENSNKKIIVYPQTISWEPLQRPQQLLREFGKKGYLCFFCEPEESKLNIRQISKNVYAVSGEKYLVFPLKSKNVIVLCTWMLNLPFTSLLDNKIIWYDLIDRLELFSLYDADMLKLHNQVVEGADLVTYSGLELKKLVASRHDATYLPNGVIFEDFNSPIEDNNNVIEKANSIFNPIKKPIIGFYGAIAEWLDFALIKDLALLRPDLSFVFIGKLWTNIDLIKEISNIHFVDLIPYQYLPTFAKKFDITIIPFLINQITNSVSPIKLFEYAALGKPVVATPFFEITQYQDQSFIRLANTSEEFSEKIDELLQIPAENIEREAKLFAQKNHWNERINLIEHKLKM